MNGKIHELNGSTDSSVKHKGEYPSEKRAELTLREFTRWLVQWIAGEYHNGLHSGINSTPKSRYIEAYLRRDGELPVAKPEIFDDPQSVSMLFMPAQERVIHQYGVNLWHIRYYHRVLAKFINESTNGSRTKTKRKFRFHYDPANISHVYFYHPELKRYFPIPYRQLANPPMSKWECEEAYAAMVKDAKGKVDERAIVESVKRRRTIELEAAANTKSAKRARRNTERVQIAAAAKPHLALVVDRPDKVPELPRTQRTRVRRAFVVEDL